MSNPKIQVIPSDPKVLKGQREMEQTKVNLRSELLGLYQTLPQLDIRIEELQNILRGIEERIDILEAQRAEGETRKLELEQMLRGL